MKIDGRTITGDPILRTVERQGPHGRASPSSASRGARGGNPQERGPVATHQAALDGLSQEMGIAHARLERLFTDGAEVLSTTPSTSATERAASRPGAVRSGRVCSTRSWPAT